MSVHKRYDKIEFYNFRVKPCIFPLYMSALESIGRVAESRLKNMIYMILHTLWSEKLCEFEESFQYIVSNSIYVAKQLLMKNIDRKTLVCDLLDKAREKYINEYVLNAIDKVGEQYIAERWYRFLDVLVKHGGELVKPRELLEYALSMREVIGFNLLDPVDIYYDCGVCDFYVKRSLYYIVVKMGWGYPVYMERYDLRIRVYPYIDIIQKHYRNAMGY